MSAEGKIRTETHDRIFKIIIDNPAKKNAFSPAMMEQLSDALTELGYAPVLVGSAMEALAELARSPEGFDVVFSDVVMPGMTGIELAQEIRRRHFGLPVVLTSGYSPMLSQNGSFGFELLQKPYSIDQLARALHKIGRWRSVKRGAAE